MKAKLYKQSCGSKIAVGIEGNEQNVTERFNSFWNHGATDGEFHWQTLTRGYFWTTEEKLKKAIYNATLFEILNKYPEFEENNEEHIAEGQARDIAAHRFEDIENMSDLVAQRMQNGTYYTTEVDLENYNWSTGTKKARV